MAPRRQQMNKRMLISRFFLGAVTLHTYSYLLQIGEASSISRVTSYSTLIETMRLSCTVFELASCLSKIANSNLPKLHFLSPLGMIPFEFCGDLLRSKTKVLANTVLAVACVRQSFGFSVCPSIHSSHDGIVSKWLNTARPNTVPA